MKEIAYVGKNNQVICFQNYLRAGYRAPHVYPISGLQEASAAEWTEGYQEFLEGLGDFDPFEFETLHEVLEKYLRERIPVPLELAGVTIDFPSEIIDLEDYLKRYKGSFKQVSANCTIRVR